MTTTTSINNRELTLRAVFLGLLIGTIMTAANLYLGLYAGMTVSASIPAAILSMGLLRMLSKNGENTLLENNIVQTMASAGESLAAGIIFTLPALLIINIWSEFDFWMTTLISIGGGCLGVLFMIPLRRTLLEDKAELNYPEGAACAYILRVGQQDQANAEENSNTGIKRILLGLGLGALAKYLSSGLGILKHSVEWAFGLGKTTFYFGTDISLALVSVGYIIGLKVAILVFLGGALGWLIGVPLLSLTGAYPGAESFAAYNPMDLSWHLWSNCIRYVGVGAMIVGGLSSIYSVRKEIFGSFGIKKGLGSSSTSSASPLPHQMDLRNQTRYYYPISMLFTLLWHLL